MNEFLYNDALLTVCLKKKKQKEKTRQNKTQSFQNRFQKYIIIVYAAEKRIISIYCGMSMGYRNGGTLRLRKSRGIYLMEKI